jgi:hypothetical protein
LEHPVVKAMRDAEGGSTEVDCEMFGRSGIELDDDAGTEMHERVDFLFPHGRESISMPVRIPVDVRSPVLQGGGASFAEIL